MIWDADQYAARHRYVTDHGASLIELLDPKPGERILDFGSGAGRLTHEIAQSGASVVGIDSSPEMIAHARTKYPNIQFELADGLTYRPQEPFDAVFSNAVLHWMRPPEAAAASLAAALRPGGRLIAEFGGRGNTRSVTEAIGLHPWYYPSIGEYASLLERHDLETLSALLYARPTPIEGESGLRDWLKMFASDFLSEDRISEVERRLRPKLYRDGIWTIDYVRLRIKARRVCGAGVHACGGSPDPPTGSSPGQ